ncbi:MAG: hypothetical protein NTW04_00230, partial [Elusimicrobia bacterium]|nr:hypothetical protein [Elusimicrobiota bacterium]
MKTKLKLITKIIPSLIAIFAVSCLSAPQIGYSQSEKDIVEAISSENVTGAATELKNGFFVNSPLRNGYSPYYLRYLIDLAVFKESLPLTILFVESGAKDVGRGTLPGLIEIAVSRFMEAKNPEECLAIIQYLMETRFSGLDESNRALLAAIRSNVDTYEMVYLLVKMRGVNTDRPIYRGSLSFIDFAKCFGTEEMTYTLQYFGTWANGLLDESTDKKIRLKGEEWEERKKARSEY